MWVTNFSTKLIALVSVSINLNPLPPAGYDTRSIFKHSKVIFSFSKTGCLTKAKEPSLPYYLPIAGARTDGFIPFPKALGQTEM